MKTYFILRKSNIPTIILDPSQQPKNDLTPLRRSLLVAALSRKKSDKKRRCLYLIIAAGTQQEAVANKSWSAEFFIRSFKGWENNVQEYRFYSLNAIKSNNAWEL